MDKKRKAESTQKAVVDVKRAKIDAVIPRLDTQSITSKPGTNLELDLQLEWDQWLDLEKPIPPKKILTQKEDQVAALVAAVKGYNEGAVNAPGYVHNIWRMMNPQRWIRGHGGDVLAGLEASHDNQEGKWLAPFFEQGDKPKPWEYGTCHSLWSHKHRLLSDVECQPWS